MKPIQTTFSAHMPTTSRSSEKPIPTTCRPYKIVKIAPSVKVKNVTGIDVVGTEKPMATTCRLQSVFEGNSPFLVLGLVRISHGKP